MAIPTSRTRDTAVITIDHSICTGCGLCVSVCKDFGLCLDNGKVALSGTALFGCVACGHCMAICPYNAIALQGRALTPEHIFPLPPEINTATYEQMLALLQRRRSIREFLDTPVAPPLIAKILEAAQTAPSGVPPSDVNVLVLDSCEKNRTFAQDFCDYLKSIRWMTSPWFLTLMRPFWGKVNDEVFRHFVQPAFAAFTSKMDAGENIVTYDAPLAMYFYGSPYSDPADPIVAATYAMLSAEAMGLGTCMIGSIHPAIQHGKKARLFRQRHGIKHTSREGLFVLFGHPKVAYSKGIRRTFASIVYAGRDGGAEPR